MKATGENSGNDRSESLVDFLARFTASDQFAGIFKEGMGLVEETANYLDGPGRQDARLLDRTGAIAYATESMRLTTRLMQVASWLLLQRAVAEGELTNAQATQEKHKVNLRAENQSLAAETVEELPEGLRDLMARSLRLQARIVHLDQLLTGSAPPPPADSSPVAAQVELLRSAFLRQPLGASLVR